MKLIFFVFCRLLKTTEERDESLCLPRDNIRLLYIEMERVTDIPDPAEEKAESLTFYLPLRCCWYRYTKGKPDVWQVRAEVDCARRKWVRVHTVYGAITLLCILWSMPFWSHFLLLLLRYMYRYIHGWDIAGNGYHRTSEKKKVFIKKKMLIQRKWTMPLFFLFSRSPFLTAYRRHRILFLTTKFVLAISFLRATLSIKNSLTTDPFLLLNHHITVRVYIFLIFFCHEKGDEYRNNRRS